MTRVVDIDFTKDPRYVKGYDKRPAATAFKGSYKDAGPVYPRSKWRELADRNAKAGGILKPHISRVFNQSNEGSCVWNAFGQAHETRQAFQFGKKKVISVSPISGYQEVAGGPNTGCMVDESWEQLRDVGILPLNTEANKARFKHTMPHTGYYTRKSAGWESTAALFIGLEAYICDGTDEAASAVLDGWGVVYGRDGHCILIVELIYDQRELFEYINSWDDDWGHAAAGFPGGFGYDSLSTFAKGADYAVAIRSVKAPQ